MHETAVWSPILQRSLQPHDIRAMSMALDPASPYITPESMASAMGCSTLDLLRAGLHLDLAMGQGLAGWETWDRLLFPSSAAPAPATSPAPAQAMLPASPASEHRVSRIKPQDAARETPGRMWLHDQYRELLARTGQAHPMRLEPNERREYLDEAADLWVKAGHRFGFDSLRPIQTATRELRLADSTLSRVVAHRHAITMTGRPIERLPIPQDLIAEDWAGMKKHQRADLVERLAAWCYAHLDMDRVTCRSVAIHAHVDDAMLYQQLARQREVVHA